MYLTLRYTLNLIVWESCIQCLILQLKQVQDLKTDSASNLFCADSGYSVRGVLCLCKRIIASEMIHA